MEDLRKRFKAYKCFKEEDSDIFFAREEELKRLYQLAGFEQKVLLHSPKGAGKTSLLNAGLIPLLKNSGMFNVVYFDFKNINLQNISANEFLSRGIANIIPSISYTDVLFEGFSDFWVKLKKIQSNPDEEKSLILIFDNFEDIFLGRKDFENDFFDIINEINTKEIPERFKIHVENKISQNNNLLSDSGKSLLEKPIETKIVFSVCSDNVNNIFGRINFSDELSKNSLELKYFDNNSAIKIISKTLGFSSKYSEKNNFALDSFNIEKEKISEIISEISVQNVLKPIDIQILGNYFEINSESLNEKISAREIYDFQLNLFLQNISSELINELVNFCKSKSSENNLWNKEFEIRENYPLLLAHFIELEEILEISTDINSEKSYALKSDFMFEQLKSKNLIEENINLKEKIETVKNKSKYFNFSTLAILFFAIVFVLIFNYLRKQAKENEIFAKSNMYSAYSFRYLNEDPTLSFRYAEYAYNLNKDNLSAYSALLNSYYKAEVFYAIIKNIDNKIINAKISADAKHIAVLTKKKNSFYFDIIDDKGKDLFNIKEDKTVTVFGFFDKGNQFYYADYSGKIHFFNFQGVKEKEIEAFDSPVWLIKFFKDKKNILVSQNYQVVKYNIETGENKLVFESDFDIYAADISPDGKTIAVANDSEIRIYDAECKFIKSIKAATANSYYQPMIQSLVFSGDSKKVLTAINDLKGKNYLVETIDLQTEETIIFRAHSDWINSAYFSSECDKIITSCQDKTSAVWLSSGEFVGVLQGHKANVTDAVFAENSNRIITVSSDKTIRSWSFGRLLNPLAEIKNIDFAYFSKTGLNIFTAGDSLIQLRDLTGDVIKEFRGNKKRINSLNFSSDQKYIVSAGNDKTVRVWELESNIKMFHEFHKQKVSCAVFTADSKFVISVSVDSTIIIWQAGKSKPDKVIKTNFVINCITTSPDGKNFLAANETGNIISYNFEGKEIFKINAHDGQAMSVVYSPDGKYFATTGKDDKAALWTNSGKLVKYFEGYENQVNSVEFSDDSKNILTAGDDNTIKLYDISGNEIFRYKDKGKVKKADFSPDGNYIILSSVEAGKKSGRLIVISPEKILELTNEVKIFGEFLTIDSLSPKKQAK